MAAAAGGALGDAVGVRPVYFTASLIILVVAALLVLTELWRQRSEVPADDDA